MKMSYQRRVNGGALSGAASGVALYHAVVAQRQSRKPSALARRVLICEMFSLHEAKIGELTMPQPAIGRKMRPPLFSVPVT